ncbi:unnamed protein product [Chrysoparadoxa australica]
MRFKARIGVEQLGVFSGVITVLEKVGSTCIMHISKNHIKFTVPTGPDELQAFSEINQKIMFTEYRFDSKSKHGILLEVNLGLLSRALASGKKHAAAPQMKLAKRAGLACLCVEVRAQEVAVKHDIPVKIMDAAGYTLYLPPEIEQPQVQLELPRLKSLRTVVDRMRGMDKHIYIDANMSGSLVFRIETDDATIKTFYNNLQPRFESLDPEKNRANSASVKLDGRKLSNVFHIYSMNFEAAICCLIEDASVVVHVFLEPSGVGTFTFFLPVLVGS